MVRYRAIIRWVSHVTWTLFSFYVRIIPGLPGQRKRAQPGYDLKCLRKREKVSIKNTNTNTLTKWSRNRFSIGNHQTNTTVITRWKFHCTQFCATNEPLWWKNIFLNHPGGASVCQFVLAMELVGVHHRHFAGIICFFAWSLSLMTLPLFAYFIRDWRLLNIILSAQGLPAVFFWW